MKETLYVMQPVVQKERLWTETPYGGGKSENRILE